jgi:quercetin 2,3-dioxygenase
MWLQRRRLLAPLAAGPLILSCQRGRAPAGTTLPRSQVAVLPAQPTLDGQGARVHRVFPAAGQGPLDPFVLLDEFEVTPPAGFPMHPHRGFEAFTYMVEGSFHHQDNLGNSSVIHGGGTQRFTSGSGAWHSEMPGTGGGAARGLQLWVNLPRRLKKMDPSYGGVPGERIPQARDRHLLVRTVVGEHAGVRSPVTLETGVKYVDVAFTAAGELAEWIDRGWEALLYVLRGRVMVGDTMLAERHAARLGPGLASVLGDAGSRVVLLEGRPHNEPIYQRGPFVD